MFDRLGGGVWMFVTVELEGLSSEYKLELDFCLVFIDGTCETTDTPEILSLVSTARLILVSVSTQ